MELLTNIALILVVLLSFNLMIFIHELGHFLAARWRGVKVEKFQIWFGKPIWKKTINGVQYGLGTIPAGGFVLLPQMAPMDTLEGDRTDAEPLPPISPIDKIIVAVAGPLFSLGFALVLGLLVWGIGKPLDIVDTTTVGYVKADSPAEKAGLLVGDKILAIDGKPVTRFAGGVEGITESIVLSTHENIRITVAREGQEKPIELVSGFEVDKKSWFERRGLRQIGISYASTVAVKEISQNSPASKAKLLKGDVIESIDGAKLWSTRQLQDHVNQRENQPVRLGIRRGTTAMEIVATPVKPCKPDNIDGEPLKAMLGIGFADADVFDERIVHPNPIKQCTDSVKMMVATFTALLSPKSNVGIDQLSGPISIADVKFQILKTDHGLRRLLAFLVLINVNLAIFNMLPFPVLDGGHITMATMELIARRPVRARILEFIQQACAILLIGVFLFITSKDIGQFFTGGKKNDPIEFCP